METDKRSPAETDRGIGMQNENGRAEESYAAAVRVMNAANSEVGFRSAAKMFGEAGGFRDAAALGKHCLEQAENCRRDAIYGAAKAQMAEETLSGFDAAARGFSSIPGWKDADELLSACREGFVKLKKEKDALYAEKKRKEEEDRKRCGKRRKRMKILLAAAVIAMIALIAFLFVWQYAILPGVRYDSAVELYRAGEFEEARSAFLELKGYGDSREWVRTCIAAIKDRKYSDAVKMFEDGRFEEAKAVFTGLEDYRDSRSYAIRCNDRLLEQTYTVQMSALTDAAVGSYVKFGMYEQYDRTASGPTEIEWLVLDKEDGRLLLISKYALDCQRFGSIGEETDWEKSSLRKWLNEVFFFDAFGAGHRGVIAASAVTADKNPEYDTPAGRDTVDRVFLLSADEAARYFANDEARMCMPTEYAIVQRAWKDVEHIDYPTGVYTTCWWWLRTPGSTSERTARVRSDGSIDCEGSVSYHLYDAVRPAVWIYVGKAAG